MAQPALLGGRVVMLDPVADRDGFTAPAGSPAWQQLAGPRALADHPPAVLDLAPVIPLPVPPGTLGRLVRLPGGRMGMTPSNLIPLAAPPPGPPINIDPPPGQAVIQGQPDGTQVVLPLPLSFAADDAGQINAALLQNPNVRLVANGVYNIQSTISVPWNGSLTGDGTPVLNYSGNGSCVFKQDPLTVQPPDTARRQPTGTIAGFTIDGTNAGANAILLDTRDLHFGLTLGVNLRNATGASAVAWQCANQNLAMNGVFGFVTIANCQTAVLFNSLGAQNAIEHLHMTLEIAIGAGQSGIVLANSVGIQGSLLRISVASVSSTSGPGLTMGAGTAFQTCVFDYKHEMNPAPGTAQSVLFQAASAKFTNCSGIMFFGSNLLPASGIAVPNTNRQFAFHGPVIGDSVLTSAMSAPLGADYTGVTVQTPAVAASGTAVTNNNGVACWVTLSGGTLTAATQIAGPGPGAVGDTNTRTYLVPGGSTITLTYSAAPTWVWQPV